MFRYALALLLFPTSALAQDIPADISETATGLAQIMTRAEKCGYEIDPTKLKQYFVDQGLDRPDVLAWISHKSAQEAGWVDQTTADECVITKATAESIAVVK